MNSIETKIEYNLFFNRITNSDDTYEADCELGTFYITEDIGFGRTYTLSFDTGIESYDETFNSSNGENLYEEFSFTKEQIIMCEYIKNNINREYSSFDEAALAAEMVNLFYLAIINN